MRLLPKLSYALTLLGVIVTFDLISKAHAHEYPNPILTLNPHSKSSDSLVSSLNCLSWRLAVETNNIRDWNTVPVECQGHVRQYMLGAQYRKDCAVVTASAYDYVKTLKINKGKDVWIFDIDETALSNAPYYARPDIGFGVKPYNATGFNEWVAEGVAPAIPSALNLYKRLLRLGVKVVFLTGTAEQYREVRIRNLKNVGYLTWEQLILKNTNEAHMKAVDYKSKRRTELENMGYRIIGNIGDQWSDILGPHPGLRTFKLPNPIYFVS